MTRRTRIGSGRVTPRRYPSGRSFLSASGRSRLSRARMTTAAPSDHLRDVYERRGELQYAVPVVPDPTLDRKYAVVTEELRAFLPVASLLDAGCGDGRYLASIGKLGAVPGRLVGVDIAESILATAALAAEQAGIEVELEQREPRTPSVRRLRVRARRLLPGDRASARAVPRHPRAGPGARTGRPDRADDGQQPTALHEDPECTPVDRAPARR